VKSTDAKYRTRTAPGTVGGVGILELDQCDRHENEEVHK